MTQARIAPGSRREVGLFTWLLAHAAGIGSRTEPMKLFLTLGRHRRLFRGWLRFAGRLMPGGTLRRRESEMVILRVAHLRSCAYELEHHLRLGRRAGLSRTEIERVFEGPAASGWSPREAALLAAADEVVSARAVGDATWSELARHLGERELIELTMLAAHYDMLATVIGTLGIRPDARR